jgi:hypothetical protein
VGTTLLRGSEKQTPPFGRNDKGYVARDDSSYLWASTCATVGAGAWAGIAVLARLGIGRIGAIELMFLFAPLVIVPLGIELGREMGAAGWYVEVARRSQPVGAALAIAAMFMPPGRVAGLIALGWMLVCGLMAWSGVVAVGHIVRVQIAREGRAGEVVMHTRVAEIASAVARIDLAVGGAWLVASRLGMRPMGIQEPIGLLTAVHFHFAGFATATIAAATLRFAEGHSQRRGEQRWLRRVVMMVVALPYLVAAGFVTSPMLKMAAALLFSASVAALAVFLRSVAKRANDGTAGGLLQIAAGSVFAGMVFAAAYVIADFMGSEALPIPQMVRTHGILNAVGFCLPGLLGWLVENGAQ